MTATVNGRKLTLTSVQSGSGSPGYFAVGTTELILPNESVGVDIDSIYDTGAFEIGAAGIQAHGEYSRNAAIGSGAPDTTWKTMGSSSGRVIVTVFDGRLAKGTFTFVARREDDPNDSVTVTGTFSTEDY